MVESESVMLRTLRFAVSIRYFSPKRNSGKHSALYALVSLAGGSTTQCHSHIFQLLDLASLWTGLAS